MTAEFQGPRTAIVTGGARRIGAELCRYLACNGWHLLIHCFHSRDEGEKLADELGNSRIVAADLADVEAAARIIAALEGLPPARLLGFASILAHRSRRGSSRTRLPTQQRNRSREESSRTKPLAHRAGCGGRILRIGGTVACVKI